MTAPLEDWSTKQLLAAYRRRAASPVEVVRHLLDRVRRLDGVLNAFVEVYADDAVHQAQAAERALARGEGGALVGVPVAVKDLFDIAERPTRCGSSFYCRVPDRDAAAVARLRRAGAVILGKTGLHEFAYGTTSENSHYGPVRNPWDPDRISGGSSGGSAAALAARLCYGALGTDTGGSIRIPAALCGVVGFKPSRDQVSTRGVVPLSWSLDHVGPMARGVEDAALMFRVMRRRGLQDQDARRNALKGMRIGLVQPWLSYSAPEVEARIRDAGRDLERLGTAVREVTFPHLEEMRTAAALVQMPEASAFHRDWLRKHVEQYGADVRHRLLLGLVLPAPAHAAGHRARRLLADSVRQIFRSVDLLLAPAVLVAACPIGTQTVTVRGRELDVRFAYMGFNQVINLAGLPAISVPCGRVCGLPVGLQFIGPVGHDEAVLEVARAYEQARSASVGLPALKAAWTDSQAARDNQEDTRIESRQKRRRTG